MLAMIEIQVNHSSILEEDQTEEVAHSSHKGMI